MSLSSSDLERIRDVVRAVVRQEFARWQGAEDAGYRKEMDDHSEDGEWVTVDPASDYCESCHHMRKHHRAGTCHIGRKNWTCQCTGFVGPPDEERRKFRPPLTPEGRAEVDSILARVRARVRSERRCRCGHLERFHRRKSCSVRKCTCEAFNLAANYPHSWE